MDLEMMQEQAAASWINSLNQKRITELIQELSNQDINLEQALAELQKLKALVGDPNNILGSVTTKHGEIAENIQVYISNARQLIEGLEKEYSFDGVGRTAPEDYLKNGNPVQSKFLNGLKSTLMGNGNADGVLQHLKKYEDFVKNGGTYVIPKDQYDEMIRVLNLRETTPSALSKEEWRILHVIDSFEKESGLSVRTDINPSIAKYSEVQQGTVTDTIKKEENYIKETDQVRRDKAYQDSRPTFREAGRVAAVSAVLEGGVAFCSGVAKKRKEGKTLGDFTIEDWRELGINTTVGTAKGGIRGATVYTLSNFTATPANIATGLVTATFGVGSQARQLQSGKITSEEFLINSEALCLDVSISTVSALLGQTLIPIPVLGAIIGNTAGMFLYDIAKNQGLVKEQSLIQSYTTEITVLDQKLEVQFHDLLQALINDFKKFKSMVDLAFDPDINKAFESSIELARLNGVEENRILKSKADIDSYFLL